MKAEITAAVGGTATATLAAVTRNFNINCSNCYRMYSYHIMKMSPTYKVSCALLVLTSELAM